MGIQAIPLALHQQKALLKALRSPPKSDVFLSLLEDQINAYRFALDAARFEARQARALLRRFTKTLEAARLLIEQLRLYPTSQQVGRPDMATVAAARHMLQAALIGHVTPESITRIHSTVATLKELSAAAHTASSSAPVRPRVSSTTPDITPRSERVEAQTRFVVALGRIYWWATDKRPTWSRSTIFYGFVDCAFRCAGEEVADLRDRIQDARPSIEAGIANQ